MPLRFCVLGSGSSGNAIFVASDTTGLLIDAGLSARETLRRLERAGEDAGRISAICLTHEHSDHIAGLGALYRKLGVGLYANSGTAEAVQRGLKGCGAEWRVFTTG